MSHLFYSRIGSYRLLLWWITWPDVLLGCFLVLTWYCFLLTDWILLFSWQNCPLSHDWGLSLVFSASVPLASVSSYCRGDPDQLISWHHIRLWRSCCCSSSSCLVSHVFYFFFFFLYIIGILFKISCCYTFCLVTLLRQIVIR